MEFIKNNKGIIFAVIIFLVAIFIYKIITAGGDIADQSAASENIGADIIALSKTVDKVTLDQSIFANPLFRNLKDFTTTIPAQPIGRKNPFDFLGR